MWAEIDMGRDRHGPRSTWAEVDGPRSTWAEIDLIPLKAIRKRCVFSVDLNVVSLPASLMVTGRL